MKIVEVRDISVPLIANIRNSVVDFSRHNVSLVAVVSDVIRAGKPVVGLAFNSIGRFAQSGLLRERFIPRVLAADADALLDDRDAVFDPARVERIALRDEKPGGHGDRAGAVAAIEMAVWDLNAKLRDEPAFIAIARAAGIADPGVGQVPVYAAGGYYYGIDNAGRLADELRGYADQGYRHFKMKIGGATRAEDLVRIDAAVAAVGDPGLLAIDANGRFSQEDAIAFAEAISDKGLRWYEEPGDPLDYALNAAVTARYAGAVATGENLFSAADVRNLVRFGGMRPEHDLFQMDPGLSYGIGEFGRMIGELETHGFGRKQIHPHGGHLIGLHVAAGYGLGGCEAYPGVFDPFGGYPDECIASEGMIKPTDAPGFGLEQKSALRPWIDKLLA